MKRIAIALAILATPVVAATPEWTFIAEDKDNTKTYLRTVDYNAGRPDQQYARAWVMTDNSRDRTVSYQSSKALYTVNCVTETYHALSVVLYYPDRTNKTLKNFSREYAVPGTVMGEVVEALCADPTPARSDSTT